MNNCSFNSYVCCINNGINSWNILTFTCTALDILWTLNPSALELKSISTILGYFLLFIGIITLSAGIGLLKGRKWAWWIVVIIFILNGIGDIQACFRWF